MKIALIADTHWGIKNDSSVQHDHLNTFLDTVFFPTLHTHGINHVVHLGDIVDRRKYINYNTAKRLRHDFLNRLAHNQVKEMHIIAGNHDVFYKNTNEINALEELIGTKYNNICIHTEPCEIRINEVPLLLLPWINDDNRQRTQMALERTTAQIVLGHLELVGFELFRGHVNTHGDDPSIFDGFDLVCSGHYHTRSNNGNIHYLGSPVQFTWSDYNDRKGFHILDLHTRELTFVPNPVDIFHKHFYDDLNKEMDDVLLFDADKYKNCYVKVIVKNKTNPMWFDNVIDRIEKAGVADMQVVEDHLHLDLTQDDEIIDQAESTVAILHKYIDGMNINADKKRVETIIQNLYSEALTIG